MLLLALLLAGCAGAPPQVAPRSRPFTFHEDSFAYANELVWEYHFNPVTGETEHVRREPAPDYTLHCFVVARAARQFFDHARFAPSEPRTTRSEYRELIQQVVSRGTRQPSAEPDKVVIPGYTNLYQFSEDYEDLLKESCGGLWHSYFQRGNWRMIFPLTRGHQEETAQQLALSLERNRPPVVHLVRFPSLAINHAVLLFDVQPCAEGLEFATYDPNSPDQPTRLTYHRATRTFTLPRNHYFSGGRVDVYEIYRSWNF